MQAVVKSFLLFLTFFLTFASAAPVAHNHKRSPSPAEGGATAKYVLAETISSSKPQSTSHASSNGVLSSLFPTGTSGKSWSTSPEAPHALPLSDSTLNPTHVMQALSHDYINAPDGKKSMQAIYPKGSFTYKSHPVGGISFYATGPKDVDLSTAKEAIFAYSVYFEKGFDFNMGGKLPGIYGGNSDEEAIGCSGGRRDVGCFSARLMWRKNGAGEMYTYLPPGLKGNTNVCHVKPLSECNPTYGASVGRGSFTWATGGWTTVSERVKLNDVNQANGELELFVGGKSVISVKGLTLRNSAAGLMRGIQMQTFFGGHSEEYASPKNQKAYFSDFSVAILDTL